MVISIGYGGWDQPGSCELDGFKIDSVTLVTRWVYQDQFDAAFATNSDDGLKVALVLLYGPSHGQRVSLGNLTAIYLHICGLGGLS
jgi:hypothetical protein